MLLTVTKGNKQIEVTIVVTGDVSGEGDITAQDLASQQNYFLEDEVLNEAQIMAVDFSGEGAISAVDMAEELELLFKYFGKSNRALYLRRERQDV